MILTLQVVGEQAGSLGAAGRKVFSAIGGTIGRLPDNDWVFPDPYISGRHALIRYLHGKYFIEDTSTNGVFVNTPDNRLQRTQPHQLRHGDKLFIDAYEIQVSIEKDPAAKPSKDPFADPRAAAAGASPKRAVPPVPAGEDHTASMVLSDAEEFDDFEDGNAANSTEWVNIDMAAAKQAHGRAPASHADEALAAADVSPKLPRPSAPQRAPAPTERERVDRDLGFDSPFEQLLAAAGIDALDPSGEAADMLGELLRISVAGVMEGLRARERMKDELRVRGTSFKAANNNPLKFSANVDDALHNLFVKRNPAYLQPTEAFEDAFRDVRDHQTALLSAMRLAFEGMLAHFDPERMQEEFDRQLKKGSILGVPAKLRYWDMYREKYGDMVKDAEASFRNLFGSEFAKAYEEHLARLRASGRGRSER